MSDKARQLLENLVAERTAQLTEANSRLLQANALLQREIDERKRVEGRLREAEERYRKLFDAESDAILLVDDESGRFVDANPAAERTYGYCRRELLAMSPEDISAEPETTRSAIAAGETSVRLRWHRRKDGSVFPVEISLSHFLSRGRKMHVAAIRDISLRMAAEKSLRLQSAALDAAANAIVITNENGVIEWVNQAFTTLSGWSKSEAQGRNPRELVKSGRHDAAFYRLMWDTITAGQVWSGEITNRHRNGSLYTVEKTITPVRNDKGRITHFIAIDQDVTAPKIALDQFRMLKQSIDLHGDGAFWTDEDDRIIYVNDAGCQMHGYTRGELIGSSLTLVNPNATPERMQAVRQRLRATGVYRNEARHRRKDGVEIPVDVVASLVKTDRGEIVLGVARDITERKRTESALRESEEKFSKAFQFAPIALLVTAVEDGTIIDGNAEFTRMSGYSLGEVAGRTTTEIGWISPEIRQELKARIDSSGRISRTELTLKTKEGKVVDCLFEGEVIEINGQRRMLSMMIDLTDSRQMELQLRQAQKMEAIGQLAGGVAHDFNNILSAMLLHFGLLRDRPDLTADARSTMLELEREAVRAATMTRQLLVFSRRQPTTIEALNLNRVLADLLMMLGRVLGETITIDWKPNDAVPSVDADAGMVEQVIMNLCLNARDAMPDGGRLSLRLSAVTIEARGPKSNLDKPAGEFVRLSVADTGCGMDQATKARLFEPFFTTKQPGKGTGLGLATVYGIAKQHKGWVEVETEPGHGSTFHVFLPAGSRKPAVYSKPPAAELPGGSGETVLVVEDEDPVRRALAVTLKRFGYLVLEARDGHEALREMELHGDVISLVLSDMVLPGRLNGAELAKRLQKANPSLPAIIASGYTHVDTPIDLANVPLVAKPYDLAAVLVAVRNRLDGMPLTPSPPE